MTSPQTKNTLRERYVGDKLRRIAALAASRGTSGGTRYLEERYITSRVASIVEASVGAPPTGMLTEALSTDDLKKYLEWFKQVKEFTGRVEVPALKRAVAAAYEKVKDAFGKEKPEGFLSSLRRKFAAGERAAAIDSVEQLEDVNHFLWGVTQFVADIPTFLKALDTQLDGQLGKRLTATATVGEAEGDVGRAASLMDAITSAAEAAEVSGWLGGGGARQFSQLVAKSLNTKVKGFKSTSVPFIDPKKLAADLLGLSPDDLDGLVDAAADLKSRWEGAKADRVELTQDVAAADDEMKRGKLPLDASSSGDESKASADAPTLTDEPDGRKRLDASDPEGTRMVLNNLADDEKVVMRAQDLVDMLSVVSPAKPAELVNWLKMVQDGQLKVEGLTRAPRRRSR